MEQTVALGSYRSFLKRSPNAVSPMSGWVYDAVHNGSTVCFPNVWIYGWVRKLIRVLIP